MTAWMVSLAKCGLDWPAASRCCGCNRSYRLRSSRSLSRVEMFRSGAGSTASLSSPTPKCVLPDKAYRDVRSGVHVDVCEHAEHFEVDVGEQVCLTDDEGYELSRASAPRAML